MSTESWKQRFEGNWNELKGRVKQEWGELTDDDTDVAEGEWDELVGNIQQATGKARQDIEAWFERTF